MATQEATAGHSGGRAQQADAQAVCRRRRCSPQRKGACGHQVGARLARRLWRQQQVQRRLLLLAALHNVAAGQVGGGGSARRGGG